MASDESDSLGSELLTDDEALAFIEKQVSGWEFADHTDFENINFALHVAYWSLEVFGQSNDKGEFFLYDGSNFGEGFPGDELPESLRPLVAYEFQDDLCLQGHNSLTLTTSPDVVETDPYIPKWEELKAIPVFTDMLERVRNDPEIMSMIIPGQLEVMPGVDIRFTPAHFYKWGLQYSVSPTGITVIPYGEYGHTSLAFNHAVEMQGRQTELAGIVCQLSALASRHTYRHSRPVIESVMVDLFHARLNGAVGIPVNAGDYAPKPGNSMKNLLIMELTAELE